jgi:hypothetical protein
MLKQSVKMHRFVLCGGFAACYAATPPQHNDVILPIILT